MIYNKEEIYIQIVVKNADDKVRARSIAYSVPIKESMSLVIDIEDFIETYISCLDDSQ